ncbi:MAG TPA: PA2779 family protein [Gammaproteobacteria bacterium]|nr:PA2779 family protein [Gammaproteobacteria bacterium]
MPHRHRTPLVIVLTASMFAASLQSAAYGGVIGTQQYLTAIDREATRQRIDSVLAREEVRDRLEQYGVDPAALDERIAALTDQELQQLATDLDNMPAGGSLLAVIGVAFIVLLILELVGVIDIFNKI